MNRKLAFRFARAAGGALAVALVLGGVAQAITSNVFTYDPPKTGWYQLSPMGFAPNGHTSGDDYVIAWPNHPGVPGGYLGSASGACFNAPINLPHGAKMTTFTAWYRSDTNMGIGVRLFRTRVSDGTSNTISVMASSDISGNRTSMTDDLPTTAVSTINNQAFAYSVGVCVQDNGELYYGGRITYTYTSAGD